MKNWKSFFTMAGLVFLISISVFSCQTNDVDDYSQGVVDLTAADLFIASEAHQNLEKEIRKNMRRRQNAISKFSKKEMEQYQQLKEKLLNMETRDEAKTQWNNLLGYDYYASLDRISKLVREVYEGTDFTRLELMRARQKQKMHKVTISTRTDDDEAIRECIKAFSEIAEWRTEDCHREYDQKINELPFDLSWKKLSEWEEKFGAERDQCIKEIDNYLKTGIENCESSNGTCPITVFH